MLRRLVIFLVVGLGLALAALFVFRTTALEALLADALTERGVAVGNLSVTEVGLDELRIVDLRLGANDELSLRSLRIGFQPATLLRGEVEIVVAEGLVLRLDLRGNAPPLGSLQSLVTTADGNSTVPLPTLELRDARIEAATPFGPVTATLDGEAWPEDAGEIGGAFSFTLTSAQGRLTGAFDLSRTVSGAMTGNLVVEDGVLSLPGAEASGLLGEAGYALAPGRLPKLDAWLSAASIALPGAELPLGALEETRIDLRAAGNTAELTARLGGAGKAWSLALTATFEDYLAAPSVRFDMTGEAEAGAAVWPLLTLPGPAAGMAILRAQVVGGLAPFSELGHDGANVVDWLARATLDGHVAATLGGLTYPERVETLSGRLRIGATLEDGALTYRSEAPMHLVLANLAPDWLRGLGLPAPAMLLLEPGVRLSLKAQGKGDRNGLAGPVSLTLRTPGGAELDARSDLRLAFGEERAIEQLELDGLQVVARRLPLPGFRLRELHAAGALAGKLPALAGDLDLRLEAEDIAIGPLRAAAARAAFPVALRAGPNELALRLTGPGRVSLDAAAYGETLRVAALQATVKEGELTYAGGALTHRATLALAPSQVRVRRADGDLTAELTPGTVRFQGSWAPHAPYRATVKIADAGLVLPTQEIAVAEVAGSLVLGPAPGALAAEIAFGAISDRAEAPRFTPLAGNLSARGDGATVTFEGALHDRAGAARLAISGRHDLAAGRGAAKLALDPLTFAPGGLQPAALTPLLADLHRVAGALRAEAEVAWTAEGLTGGADLALEDLSFDSGAAEVRGLDLELSLSGLMPPASAPGQRLTVRRIDPGVALDDVALRFQIHPGEPPRLGIEQGRFQISGGRILLRDLLLDPAAPRLELPFEVEGLDLAELFRILDIEGLSGSGRLSGRIPVALEGETVTIADGRLTAEGPGTLRFDSAQASQALAAAGESADLMLRALQDFRYDELSLAIDKPAAADARLTLVLLGHNPAVLDGYPFRFNINLEGDTDRLVAALSQAYSLSNRMLRKFWRPAQK